MSSNSDSQNQEHNYSGDENPTSSSSSYSFLPCPPPRITEDDLLVIIGGGSTHKPTTSEAWEGFVTFEKIFTTSAQPGLPIMRAWFTTYSRVTKTRGWAKLTDDYRAWFYKISYVKSESWKAWGLDEMFSLSTFNIPTNYEVLLPLPGFLSTELNVFIFPFMGNTYSYLLNVVAITGLPIDGSISTISMPEEFIQNSLPRIQRLRLSFLTPNTRLS